MSLRLPLLVLTGAGISAESGVPTFRGVDGLWRNYRAEELATPEAFAADPKLVWEWYDWRRREIAKCTPNAAHRSIVEIESHVADEDPDSFLLVTQNVDGLHELAGSERMERIHGSIWEVQCIKCGWSGVDRSAPLKRLPPTCRSCKGTLRPGVVWFGESLNAGTLRRSVDAAEGAGTVLVVGTSSLVYPAAALPETALRRGAHVVEFNIEDTPLTPFVHESVRGPAAEALPQWWARQVK